MGKVVESPGPDVKPGLAAMVGVAARASTVSGACPGPRSEMPALVVAGARVDLSPDEPPIDAAVVVMHGNTIARVGRGDGWRRAARHPDRGLPWTGRHSEISGTAMFTPSTVAGRTPTRRPPKLSRRSCVTCSGGMVSRPCSTPLLPRRPWRSCGSGSKLVRSSARESSRSPTYCSPGAAPRSKAMVEDAGSRSDSRSRSMSRSTNRGRSSHRPANVASHQP
jgi:hypothetical protein